MKKYFLTSEALGLILDRNSDGIIDWALCGFDKREVAMEVQKGCQGYNNDNIYVSVLPISDELQLNKTLGGLVATADTAEEFNKIITEEEALQIISTLTKEPKQI